MPSKKKKYNARFPPARIKKIMQTDEEIGKVAAAVPVIISRALELFLESLLKKACQVTQSRNAKTMTTSHLKQCIELEQQFDFLKDLVASVPDMQGDGEDNHMDGDKGARRWGAGARCPGREGQGHQGWGWLGGGQGVVRPLGRWTVPSRRGRKPGSGGRKNGGMGSKGKDKKLSGTDSEQEDESDDTDTDGEEETSQAPPQASHPPAHFQSPPTPFMPFTSSLPLPPAPPGPSAPDAEDEEDYDS
ncbi:dr1-associated corepressor isoform X1 [Prionailurus bengalensis]|uniref:dr1-associated corepressor isoform X1 n=1 Tax=Prionailurus bengalensis TaxID=37029 RepID=UPI001CA9F40E|nr:dr1-associated corepressor isoform X1 [Prionailurus bengalensis]